MAVGEFTRPATVLVIAQDSENSVPAVGEPVWPTVKLRTLSGTEAKEGNKNIIEIKWVMIKLKITRKMLHEIMYYWYNM